MSKDKKKVELLCLIMRIICYTYIYFTFKMSGCFKAIKSSLTSPAFFYSSDKVTLMAYLFHMYSIAPAISIAIDYL
jgi:hypothetical protein